MGFCHYHGQEVASQNDSCSECDRAHIWPWHFTYPPRPCETPYRAQKSATHTTVKGKGKVGRIGGKG